MTPASSVRANGYFDLELKIDKCKFYPFKPLAVIAGCVVTVPSLGSTDADAADPERKTREEQFIDESEFEYVEEQLEIGTRCLVYVNESSGQVPSLISRWASECREKKKCTNWIEIAEHRAICRIDIDTNSTNSVLEECRSVPGAWMLRSSEGFIQICDPPTVRVTIMMDQSKFYPTKLAILDGVIRDVDRNDLTLEAEEKSIDLLESGERCWLNVRSNVVSLLKTLHGDRTVDSDNDTKRSDGNKYKQKSKISTGWVQLTRSIPVSCRVIINNDLLERKSNVKGALVLECYEVLDVPKDNNFDNASIPFGSKETASTLNLQNYPFPRTRADRKERHRIFAEWLVKTFGADYLSAGSGVLDVAGGNGALGTELWKFGVKSTLLDPEPRCDAEASPFQVISEPLVGNGSELTGELHAMNPLEGEERRRIRHLILNCSVIAGMHPDEATEAVIDTSLRLGKPFAILPCCVFRNLNIERQEIRKQKRQVTGGTDPFRSYSTFCHYLLRDKAPPGIRFQTQNLPFEGRNKVVYMLSDSFLCKEIKCN